MYRFQQMEQLTAIIYLMYVPNLQILLLKVLGTFCMTQNIMLTASNLILHGFTDRKKLPLKYYLLRSCSFREETMPQNNFRLRRQ